MTIEREKCTCVGCPVTRWRILSHVYQEMTWQQEQIYVPCDDAECNLNCQRNATQEDLLCDHCREYGGISNKDERRILAILTDDNRKVAVNQRYGK